jgi:3-hydroxymyristoyl/3-hydroxydecanoyl-(acyl carrier protein) dehydratase
MIDATTFSQTCSIDAGHPALAGHFPGRPLVPGVTLLEQVAMALRAWRQQRLARVVEAKFIAPLLPGQRAQLRLTAQMDSPSIRFMIERDGLVLARGVVEGAP